MPEVIRDDRMNWTEERLKVVLEWFEVYRIECGESTRDTDVVDMIEGVLLRWKQEQNRWNKPPRNA